MNYHIGSRLRPRPITAIHLNHPLRRYITACLTPSVRFGTPNRGIFDASVYSDRIACVYCRRQLHHARHTSAMIELSMAKSRFEDTRAGDVPTKDNKPQRLRSQKNSLTGQVAFQCTKADGITIARACFQRETYIAKALSHWQSHAFGVPEPLISPQRTPITNEKPTSKHSSLTGQVDFSMYRSR